ncbi:hypothetical protein evm_012324 [Chilo suppressalis]|nr:hypothetical protein evm_012324 [Chilo suppressalis]
MTNDIALVKVKTPIRFNQNVKRVVLSRNSYFNEEAFVSGWGLIDEEKRLTTASLKHVRQTLWSRHDCMKILRDVPVGSFCAGPKNSGTNYAAEGDSGSALVVRGYVQVGIVSYKIPRKSNSLVIYTEVRHFYDWIVTSTNNMFCMAGK